MSRSSNAAGGEHATRFQCGPDAISYAKAFLDKGMSYQAAARASGVNEITLREMLVKAPTPVVVPSVQRAPEPVKRPRVAKSVRGVLITPYDRVTLVIARVAASYGVTVEEIMGKSRNRPIVWARQEAYYAVKVATGAAYTRVGKIFGRDHSTIMFGVDAYKNREAARKTALAA